MIDKLMKLREYSLKSIIAYSCIQICIGIKVAIYRLVLSNNLPVLHNVKIKTPTQFMGKGVITVSGSQFGVWQSPFFLNGYGYLEARNVSAKICIGNDTVINNNFVIIADKSSIVIGCRCLIGPNFFVADSDFHELKIADRSSGNHKASSVSIGDDVFIGDNVRVLKGVNIGAGSVIGSGSLVTKDIPPNSLAAGIPAKVIRNLSFEFT